MRFVRENKKEEINMCKHCPYWYADAKLQLRCHYDSDAGKYGRSACDAEDFDICLTEKKERETA